MSTVDDSLVFAIFPNENPLPKRRRRFTATIRTVIIEGKTFRLSQTEYSLFITLARHNNKTVPYEKLYREVFADGQLQNTHHLRMYIRLLRRRIEPDPAEPRYLLTARKRGYRLALTQINAESEFRLSTEPPKIYQYQTTYPKIRIAQESHG